MEHVVGVGQLRFDIWKYVDRVLDGHTVGLLHRGRLVATMSRSAHTGNPTDAQPVALATLRRQPGRCLRRVAAGQTLLVVHGDDPVATLSPIVTGPTSADPVLLAAEALS